jgi:uncharacterized protein (TIGR02118 family)
MTRLVALYRRPPDLERFLRHYRAVHLPLIRQVPGLLDVRVQRVDQVLMGDGDYVLAATLTFADRASFDAAMASPENRAAGRDLKAMAGGLVTLMVAEDVE